MRRRLLAATLLAGAALATGCASLLPPPEAPAQEFLLEADPGPAEPAAPGELTLLVAAPSAAAAYRTTDLLYRNSGPRLRRYRDSRWSAPPAQLAAEALAADLAASGLFRAVLPSPPAQADLRLELRLLRLEQVFDDNASPSRLVVALQATLTSPPPGLLLASRRFRVSESAPANAAGAAAAASRALARLARHLRAFLAPHASTSPVLDLGHTPGGRVFRNLTSVSVSPTADRVTSPYRAASRRRTCRSPRVPAASADNSNEQVVVHRVFQLGGGGHGHQQNGSATKDRIPGGPHNSHRG